MQAITQIRLSELKTFVSGKVREVYDLGEHLLLVSTDRISAFDRVLPVGIPDKGKVLTALSSFWFRKLEHISKHHLVTDDAGEFPREVQKYTDIIRDRSMLVKKAKRIDIECIVRGYLSGSAWREYQETGTVGEYRLQPGLDKNSKLTRPIFTPTTKTASGHDEAITIRKMCDMVGAGPGEYIIAKSLSLFEEASRYAEMKGIRLMDTKFEFGYCNGEIILIDEVLTPDSSRFVYQSKDEAKVLNLDKQFIRDYLESTGWDKNSDPPVIPHDVVLECRRRYLLLLEILTGSSPQWLE